MNFGNKRLKSDVKYTGNMKVKVQTSAIFNTKAFKSFLINFKLITDNLNNKQFLLGLL